MPSPVSQGYCVPRGPCQAEANRQEPGLWLSHKQCAPQLSSPRTEIRPASTGPAAKGTLQYLYLNPPEVNLGSLHEPTGSKMG